MAKFEVFGAARVMFTMTVEAPDAEEAEDIVHCDFRLNGYCGNGAPGGRLVGHQDGRIVLETNNDADLEISEVKLSENQESSEDEE